MASSNHSQAVILASKGSPCSRLADQHSRLASSQPSSPATTVSPPSRPHGQADQAGDREPVQGGLRAVASEMSSGIMSDGTAASQTTKTSSDTEQWNRT